MSVRTYCAIHALAGLLASERADDDVHYREDIAVDRAFRMADALVAEVKRAEKANAEADEKEWGDDLPF